MKPYHIFTEEELSGKSPDELKKYLTGKVMTCAKCCAMRVLIHAFLDYGSKCYSISCGGMLLEDGCGHNIAGNSLSGVLNAWNDELDKELDKIGINPLDFPAVGPLDFATEIVII